MSEILVLAVALALDAAAVAGGIAAGQRSWRPVASAAASFAVFQAGMAGLGRWGGTCLTERAAAWDHWISFVLLAGLGGGAWPGRRSQAATTASPQAHVDLANAACGRDWREWVESYSWGWGSRSWSSTCCGAELRAGAHPCPSPKNILARSPTPCVLFHPSTASTGTPSHDVARTCPGAPAPAVATPGPSSCGSSSPPGRARARRRRASRRASAR